jgi:hypothetical protein
MKDIILNLLILAVAIAPVIICFREVPRDEHAKHLARIKRDEELMKRVRELRRKHLAERQTFKGGK